MKRKLFTSVFIPFGLMLASVLIFWTSLPNQLPVHFNIRGVADGFSSKPLALLGLPFLYLAVALLISYSDRVSQRSFQDKSPISARQIMWATGLIFLFLQLHIISYGLGANRSGFAIDQLILGMILIGLGMFTRTVDRNRWFGIRLPWTFASVENWRLAHDAWGKILIVLGYASIAISPWLHSPTLVFCASLLSIPLALAFSYVQVQRAKARR